MGLDQWFYKAKKKDIQFEKEQPWNHFFKPYGDLSRDVEYKYFRKNRLIHNYMYKHYCELAEMMDEKPIDRNDFNMVDVYVDYDTLKKMFHDFTNKNVDDSAGFFFGEQAEDYLRLEALEFLSDALDYFKDRPNECLVYTSWW